jgi:hypothetical protein
MPSVAPVPSIPLVPLVPSVSEIATENLSKSVLMEHSADDMQLDVANDTDDDCILIETNPRKDPDLLRKWKHLSIPSYQATPLANRLLLKVAEGSLTDSNENVQKDTLFALVRYLAFGFGRSTKYVKKVFNTHAKHFKRGNYSMHPRDSLLEYPLTREKLIHDVKKLHAFWKSNRNVLQVSLSDVNEKRLKTIQERLTKRHCSPK